MSARPGGASLLARRRLLVVGLSGALAALGLAAPTVAHGAGVVPTANRTAVARPAAALAPSTVGCTLALGVRTCQLYAAAGTATMPGYATPVTTWSYADSAGGAVGTVGRTLVVNQGETVALVVHNRLGQDTGLELPQVDGFSDDAVVPAPTAATPDPNHTYSFTASRPGTFLYEAGGTAQGSRQVAMGLVGALVVLPASLTGQPAGAPTTSAYGGADTAYTDESVALLTDTDPALNNAAGGPASFDMRGYAPKFHLLNGTAFPATSHIAVTAGTTALLRVVNGGIVQHAIGVLGADEKVVATSSRPLAHPYGVAALTVSAGDISDVLVSVPASGGPLFPVYDASDRLDNATGAASGVVPFGGALTFLDTGVALPTLPTITGLALSYPIFDGTDLGFTATASAGSDGSPVDSIEWVLDSATGVAQSAASGNGPVSGSVLAATIAALSNGGHSLLVRAHSTAGWGSYTAASFVVDHAGPTVSGFAASPTVTSGATIALSGNVSDVATGGSAIASVTYSVDGGAAAPLTVTPAGAVSGTFAGSITGLGEGAHVVTAVATDVRGNTGPVSTPVTVVVDSTVPTVSAVTVSPSPNNGNQGTPADPTIVEVRATVADPAAGTPAGSSGVVSGEAFLGGTTAPVASSYGTGFPLYPYPAGSLTTLLGNFPVSELTKYADGPLNVWVHAKDAAGNWGTSLAGVLVINRSAIFASSFSNGTSPFGWTTAPPPGGQLTRTIAGGPTGQMVLARSAGTWSNTSRAYLVDASPAAETRYNVGFDLTAGTFTTGTGSSSSTINAAITNAQTNARVLTIFQARTLAGVTAYGVQYRGYVATKTGSGGSTVTARQVRLVVGGSATPWQALGATQTRIVVTWVSGASATATLTVGAAAAVSLGGLNTSANTIDYGWLGVSSVSGTSGTAAVAATSMSFDNYNSVRSGTP